MKMGRPKDERAKRESLTIRLSEELRNKLMDYATNHNTTMTEVVLQSLEKFLSEHK